MTKEELRQWIIEFVKAPAYPEVIEGIDSRIKSVISQAIAENEASEWKKYPEVKPEWNGRYEVTTENGDVGIALWKNNKWWMDDYLDSKVLFGLRDDFIIAFRELPKPHQEGGEG